MSHAVLRGAPSQAQLYLDGILDAVLEEDIQGFHKKVKKRENVSVSEVLLHVFNRFPNAVFMTNTFTGESFTNCEICKRAVCFSRALVSAGAKTLLVLMRNSEHMAILYYGSIFSGAVALMLEPGSTVHEICHFIKLLDPSIIFCDEERYEDVIFALDRTQKLEIKVVIANKLHNVERFLGDKCNDVESFRLARDVSPESTFLLLPTSGSTGIPKASCLSHQGMVAQLPILWTHHDSFPTPTELALLVSTPQWTTHTLVMLTCPVYGIPILMSPSKTNAENVLRSIEEYKPSWTLLGPSTLSALVSLVDEGQLSSLRTVILTGSAMSLDLRETVKAKFPNLKNLVNGYGMTEAQSFVSLQDENSPPDSVGKICNIFDYKIVDNDDRELENGEAGELYITSRLCIFKGYFKDEDSYRQCVTGAGWLRTGDLFRQDPCGNMLFVARKKFLIKYMNYHISPEEVENVIASVPGVQESVVCGTERGAAAAVIVRPGFHVLEDQIHHAVSQLSEYKRLRGGIAFVQELPRTATGKLRRAACAELLDKLLRQV